MNLGWLYSIGTVGNKTCIDDNYYTLINPQKIVQQQLLLFRLTIFIILFTSPNLAVFEELLGCLQTTLYDFVFQFLGRRTILFM